MTRTTRTTAGASGTTGTAGVRRLALAAVALVALSSLAACGSEETAEDPSASTDTPSVTEEPTTAPSETPTETPTEEPVTEPACAEVWTPGARLPAQYEGCADESGTWVQADIYYCSSGQTLTTYGDRHYAARGRKVVKAAKPLTKDPVFKQAMAACTA